MVREILETEALSYLIKELKNERPVFLFGAGVSMIEPTGLPSGREIKEYIVNNIVHDTYQYPYLNILSSNSYYQKVVPEVLFQEIYSIIQDKIFQAYKILEIADPNLIHFTLAKFLNDFNCPLYTTNFDELVDRFLNYNKKVSHLHGFIKEPNEMGILITQIGLGVNPSFQKQFLYDTANTTLYVFGYSGSDKDIMSLIKKSSVNRVVWLMRNIKNSWELENFTALTDKEILIYQSDLKGFFQKISLEMELNFHPYITEQDIIASKRKAIIDNYRESISDYESCACLDLLLFVNGEYDAASDILNEALRRTNLMTEEEVLKIYMAQADNLRTIGKDLITALKLTEIGLENPVIAKFKMVQGNLLNIQGLILHEMNDNRNHEVLEIYKKAELVFKEECQFLKNSNLDYAHVLDGLSRVYNNIGFFHEERTKDYKLSEQFYNKGINLKRSVGHIIGLCRGYSNLCIVLLYLDEKRKFRYRLKQAKEIIDKYDLFRIREELCLKIDKFYSEIGKPDKGKFFLSQLNTTK